MPLPTPSEGQNRAEFIAECVEDENVQNEAANDEQALAICSSQWEQTQEDKHMSPNEQLLKAIKERQQKNTEFNRGILTADAYVKTLQECVGIDQCYKFASKGNVSFDDTLRKAAKTLTYNNGDMEVEEKFNTSDFKAIDVDGESIELPKNTLMVFKNVLTTPKKDRDGDIMRTQGAKPDPKMLLLWQHVHTLPIGKSLGIAQHTSNKLALITAIVDMNELAHDAAVMVDNKMGRFSHGFRALEFDKLKEDKEDEGEITGGGFDVKVFEIMEESLVSVPANTDTGVEEIFVDFAETGKFHSPLLKSFGKSLREKMPTKVNVPNLPIDVNLNVSVNGEEKTNGNGKTKSGKEGCTCGASTSKETDGDGKGTGKEGSSSQQKMMIGGNFIENSWEWIESHLRQDAKRFLMASGMFVGDDSFVFLVGTFSDHAFIGFEKEFGGEVKYFKASWELQEDKPIFVGQPQEVEIESTVEVRERAIQLQEKAGRRLNKENMKRLTEVKEDLEELRDNEKGMTRGGKAIVERDITKLTDVIGKATDEDEEDVNQRYSRSIEAKDAMAIFLAKASPEQRQRMSKSIETLDEVEERSKLTEQYEELVSS